MKIAVLGAGAMGSLFGGLLAEAGHEVELLDVNALHIERVRSVGLTLQTDGRGLRTVQLPILRPEQARGRPHALILLTKALHTATALAAARLLLRPGLLVLTLQNGLGNVERIESLVPRSDIALGVTTVPADMVEPGHVRSHGHGETRVMMADGQASQALAHLAQALTEAGLHCQVDAGVHDAVWRKVAFNAALNTVCAVTQCTVGQVGASPGARRLAHDIAGEVLAVARAHGMSVDEAALRDMLDHALDHHASHKPSMLQDLLAARPTEVDAITGEVLRIAHTRGVPAPRTEAMDALVRLWQETSAARLLPH